MVVYREHRLEINKFYSTTYGSRVDSDIITGGSNMMTGLENYYDFEK